MSINQLDFAKLPLHAENLAAYLLKVCLLAPKGLLRQPEVLATQCWSPCQDTHQLASAAITPVSCSCEARWHSACWQRPRAFNRKHWKPIKLLCQSLRQSGNNPFRHMISFKMCILLYDTMIMAGISDKNLFPAAGPRAQAKRRRTEGC